MVAMPRHFFSTMSSLGVIQLHNVMQGKWDKALSSKYPALILDHW